LSGKLSIACSVLAFVTYLFTLCPTVFVEGSGELIGAAYYLGTPHPTGYPLFTLAARLVAVLCPWGSPAFKINLASALFAAGTVGSFAWLLSWRGIRPVAAAGSALCLAYSHTFWGQAVISEVYGLSMALIVLTMGCSLYACQQRSLRALILLGWCMGVGLTAHLNQVLVIPGMLLLFVWRWSNLFTQYRYVLAACLAGLIGYSLVLYLPIRNGIGPGFHWGDLSGWGAVWDHLTGATYRSSFFSLPVKGMLLNAQRWAISVGNEWSLGFVPLLLWGGAVAWRRDSSFCLLVGTAMLCNLAIALNYHRDPNGIGVFFMLSYVCWAVFLGFALDDVVQRVPKHWVGQALVLVLVLNVFLGNYERVDLSNNRVAERYGLDILEDLPKGAVLITEGDDVAFVLDYLLRVEKKRPDLVLYNRVGRGSDLLSPAERRLPGIRQQKLQKTREAELARGMAPLFYLVRRRAPIADYEFVPSGLVYRLMPANDSERARLIEREIDMDNAKFNGSHLDPWVRKIQSNYWFMRAEGKREKGQLREALEDYIRTAEVAHDSRTVQFNVGLMALRLGDVNRARLHAQRAIEIDPFQSYGHRLMDQINSRTGHGGSVER
tara:strand:+ start:711 stop:2528 length:1818 start_codon:yes stop_codon:yes gene_type:complete